MVRWSPRRPDSASPARTPLVILIKQGSQAIPCLGSSSSGQCLFGQIKCDFFLSPLLQSLLSRAYISLTTLININTLMISPSVRVSFSI